MAWLRAASRRPSWALALWWIGAAACGPGKPAWNEPLADWVAHQETRVTTDLISATRNADSLSWGWSTVPGDEGEPGFFELTGRYGWVDFRAFEAKIVGVELEASAAGGRSRPMRVTTSLNGKRGKTLRVNGTWRKLRWEFESGSVRQGPNRLTLRPRLRRAERKDPEARRHLRVRRIRFVTAGGRRARPADLTRIRSTADGVEMPVASRLDLVAELPPESLFTGRVTVELRGVEGAGEVRVFASLLDAAGAESALFDRAFASDETVETSADLAAWAGQTVRLRLGVAGDRNARVRWSEAGIRSSRPGLRRAVALPQPPPRSGRLGRPDVVVVLIDTARADAYAEDSPVDTPHVDALAAAGSRFLDARSPAPWTGLTVPALLTGLYPDSLGMRFWGDRLPGRAVTLAELLAEAGYRTVLFTQHPVYRAQSELARGFEEQYFGRYQVREDLPNAEALLADDRPTFSLLHLLPPHAPYEPPEPHRGSLTGWYRGDVEPAPDFLSTFPHRRTSADLSSDDRRYIRQRYLENAAYADELVGRIATLLRERGRFDDAMFVVLSDHGEAFLEHGRFLHTDDVYREFVHVPLVIKWPASVGGFADQVAGVVNVIDLAPTLIDGLGVEADGVGFQGASLLPAAFGETPAANGTYATTEGVSSYRRPPRPRLSVEVDGWRVVHDLDSGRSELFRLEDDPLEQRDLSSRFPTRALLLEHLALRQRALNRQTIAAALTRSGEGPVGAGDIDPETEAELKALGYL